MKTFTAPIFSTAPYNSDRLPSESWFLGYSIEDLDAGQSSRKNRLVGVPQVNLAEYKCRAVFDWMEVLVNLPKQVYTRDVGRMLKARMLDPTKGGAMVTDAARMQYAYTDQLLIRLQDPSLKRFEKMFSILAGRYHVPMSGHHIRHRVAGFELSVDFYPRETAVKDEGDRILRRVRMSELLRKHFAPPEMFGNGDFAGVNDRLQFHDGNLHQQLKLPYGPSPKPLQDIRKPLLAASDPAQHIAAPINATVYVGASERELRYRLQDKTGNKRNKNCFEELPVRERRSRIEYTLHNKRPDGVTVAEELGIYCVRDIADFKWHVLRKNLLGFELPTFSAGSDGEINCEELEIFRKTGCFGLKLFHQGQREIERARGSRDDSGRLLKALGSKGYNQSFSKLNQKIWNAMKVAGRSFEED